EKKEHEEHLKVILELLKKEELYAKFSKCEFLIPKVQFLGHVIDSQDRRAIKLSPASSTRRRYSKNGIQNSVWKEREPPLRVRALVMTIGLDLPRQILNSQTEVRKAKNIKKEDVGGVGYLAMAIWDCDHARVP
nr:reverse transcriptase domain-containing protein [Tanacetum cinerariifolium]